MFLIYPVAKWTSILTTNKNQKVLRSKLVCRVARTNQCLIWSLLYIKVLDQGFFITFENLFVILTQSLIT